MSKLGRPTYPRTATEICETGGRRRNLGTAIGAVFIIIGSLSLLETHNTDFQFLSYTSMVVGVVVLGMTWRDNVSRIRIRDFELDNE